MKPQPRRGAEFPVSQQACRLFLRYLAGVPTTALADSGMPISRVNRSIKRTAKHLLAAVGSEYEKKRPIAHLSRLRNESLLWVFRLALVLPEETAASLAYSGEGAEPGPEYADAYRHIIALFREQLQQLGRGFAAPALPDRLPIFPPSLDSRGHGMRCPG